MSNIFILDENIAKSANYHADQHVISSLAEIPRMIATCYNREEIEKFNQSRCDFSDKFAEWIRSSEHNFDYVIELYDNLNIESLFRFNKPAMSNKFISWCEKNKPKFIRTVRTPFITAFALGSRARQLAKHEADVVKLYREYYREKTYLTWSNKKPEWL